MKENKTNIAEKFGLMKVNNVEKYLPIGDSMVYEMNTKFDLEGLDGYDLLEFIGYSLNTPFRITDDDFKTFIHDKKNQHVDHENLRQIIKRQNMKEK